MLNLLLATDGSKPAREAYQILRELPLPAGTLLNVLCVNAPFDRAFYEEPAELRKVWEERRQWGEQVVADASAVLERPEVEIRTSLRSGDVAHEIISAACEQGAHLIVLGSRGLSGIRDFLLGSTARNVAHHAPMSVLVGRPVRHHASRILLAVDRSAHAEAAQEFLRRRIPAPLAHLTIINVRRPYHPAPLEGAPASVSTPEGELFEERQSHSLVEDAAKGLRDHFASVDAQVRVGDPAEEVLLAAHEAQADLIVVGARGTSLLERLVLGSVADRILRNAPCSVLLVR